MFGGDHDNDDELEDDEEEMQAIAAIVMAIPNVLEDGEREEVIGVDIEGFRVMSNTSFREHFRMDRIVFQRLVVEIGLYLRAHNQLIRIRTPLDLCIMRAIWPIFNPDTFRSSGLHFAQKKAGIHFHYAYIIEALAAMSGRFIKWPDALEREEIKDAFEERYGYPGVVGLIDCVYFNISAPLEQPERYVDRHHQYSMLAQAVCDHNLLYRDVYVGEAGAIGDVRNFDRSPLSLNLLTGPHLLSTEEHILGDGAYTLTSKVLVPYRGQNLIPRQRTHNFIHSTTRSRVENSFALLKGKERRLKYLPMRNPYLVGDHIVASFVLHNFIILGGNDAQVSSTSDLVAHTVLLTWKNASSYSIEGLPPVMPPHVNDGEFLRLTDEARTIGPLKREYIALLLHPDE